VADDKLLRTAAKTKRQLDIRRMSLLGLEAQLNTGNPGEIARAEYRQRQEKHAEVARRYGAQPRPARRASDRHQEGHRNAAARQKSQIAR
jgi:hypothetical protein